MEQTVQLNVHYLLVQLCCVINGWLSMEIIETSISDLIVVRLSEHQDCRGTFNRAYCLCEFEKLIGNRTIKQINLSLTNKSGAIRGLHLQLPSHFEMKLVQCLKGAVWDVAVDLRQGSPTFLEWHAEELSEKNNTTSRHTRRFCTWVSSYRDREPTDVYAYGLLYFRF